MTPEQITAWLDANSWRMDGPAQWLGTEPNAWRKPWGSAKVRWLLAASWPYFHSAGNQSIPAVYQAINDHPDHLADLSYLAETPRDMRIMEKAGIPVFGVESKRQMADFDVAGTSISYLVLFMNFCKHLQLSGIPLRWRDREAFAGEVPMIIVGGQAACAPGAMEPVADCVWIGEVEDEDATPGGITEVCQRIARFKEEKRWHRDRIGCYKDLARSFNHLYFPRFTAVQYAVSDRGLGKPSKQVTGITPLLEGMKFPHRSRRITDMDAIKPLRSAPLLFTQPGMGAGDIEVARSCPAWCGFCRLALTTKPYRERSVKMSVAQAKEWAANMGTIELSPFGPDFPMFTQKTRLLAEFMEQVSDEVDGTAMRIDDLIADPGYLAVYTAGKATHVTLGLEGNSQRMRDLVGKGTSDKDVEETVVRGIQAGVRLFKFFMISQFPGETEADVMRIVALGRRLDEIRREMGVPKVRYMFSWTPLLIEAQTPFQWFAPTLPDHTLIKVIDALRPYKIDCKIGTKAEPNKVALFQLCQRASRDVGEAIVDVLERHSVASWGGVPRTIRDDLEAALISHGFANGFADCFDERARTDLFGWEHIDMGVSPRLLWSAYQQMVEFLQATNAETYDEERGEDYHGQEFIGRCDTNCLGAECGACESPDFRKRREYQANVDRDIAAEPIRRIDRTTVAVRIRMRACVPERLRYATNDHWRFSVRRALRRSEFILPPGVLAANRSIRLASDAVKVRDWSCDTDYIEFGLTRHVSSTGTIQRFMSHVISELSPWLAMDGYEIYPASAVLPAEARVLYCLELDQDPELVAARLAAWERAEAVPVKLAGDASFFSTGVEEINAKDLVDDVWVARAGHRLELFLMAHGKAGAYQLAAALLGLPSHLPLQKNPAARLEWYRPGDVGLLGHPCTGCGGDVLVTLLGEQSQRCDRCASLLEGKVPQLLPAGT